MKIALIHPEFDVYFTYEAPIGLAYLQAVLKKNGHQTMIIDNNVMHFPHEQLIDLLKEADVAAISMTTPTYATVKKLCIEIKQKLNIPVILGGAHPTIDPNDCLNFSDYVIMGEGENSFPKLLKAIEKKAKLNELKKIKGMGFNFNGKKRLNEREKLIENLDELPFPDWSGFPLEKYGSALRVSGRCLPVVTSRGCPFNCIYCFKGLFGLKYRTRSAENLVGELNYLKQNFGIKEFQIADDCFNLIEKRAIEICKKMIEEKIDLKWSLPNGIRANFVTDDLCYWMKKAGLDYTGLGAESGSQELLNAIGKQQTKEQVKNAVKLLKKHKIKIVGFFMFGLPGETTETMKETIDFAKELDLDYCSISMTTPYPGTRLFEEIKKGKGKLLVEKPEDLFSLGSKCKYIMPGMAPAEEIEKTYKKARVKLLLKPKTILKTAKNPKRLIAGAKVAYKWILKT